MERNPEISIIMISHNREQFIVRAMDSILGQTFQNFEFIIVDNGSTDNSKVLANAYAQRNQKIKLIHIPESLIGTARNAGLDHAVGNYITFIDDDDYAYPEMIAFLYHNIRTENADISLCGSYRTFEGKNRPYFIYDEKYVFDAEGATKEYLTRKLWNAPLPTKLLKRELFENIRFLETGLYDDIHVAYRYFVHAKKVVAEGKPLYSFTDHDGNHSSAAISDDQLYPELLEEYFGAFRERTQYIERHLPNVGAYARYSEWSYMLSMCNKIHIHHLTNCNEQLSHIEETLTKHLQEFSDSPYLKDFETKWLKKYII